MGERGLDSDDAIDTGQDVGQRDADLLRRTVLFTGQIHHAAHRLDHGIETGARRIRTVLAESGDRTVDQPGIAPL